MTTLRAEHLSVRLGGRCVLADVTASFETGRVTAIIGPNGAGKSTFLACLADLRRPDSGTSWLGERQISAMPHRERAQRIAFLHQNPEVAWAIDVETLVGLGRIPYVGGRGLAATDREAVARALAMASLNDLAARDVTTLSGGERARALIARALAGAPEWLLADEPLAGLDPGHQLDMADLLRAYAAGGRGVILTLHDLSLAARLADRVLVLADGRILADGRPAEALSPPVLAQAYEIETRVAEGVAGPLIELVGRVRG
jgi:iron complex transport system ATP-binding protein